MVKVVMYCMISNTYLKLMNQMEDYKLINMDKLMEGALWIQ